MALGSDQWPEVRESTPDVALAGPRRVVQQPQARPPEERSGTGEQRGGEEMGPGATLSLERGWRRRYSREPSCYQRYRRCFRKHSGSRPDLRRAAQGRAGSTVTHGRQRGQRAGVGGVGRAGRGVRGLAMDVGGKKGEEERWRPAIGPRRLAWCDSEMARAAAVEAPGPTVSSAL